MIVNNHTIQLNQEAQIGDIIDLHDIDTIDTSIITKKIDEAKDLEYQKRLNALKKEMTLEKENAIHKALEDAKEKITSLNEQLKSQADSIQSKLKLDYEKQVNDLRQKIETLRLEKANIEQSKQNEIELNISKKVNEFTNRMNQYQQEINQLKQEKQSLIETSKLEKENAVNRKEKELTEKINEKEQAISRLMLEKSSLNIKKMGEELEAWVDQEFQTHALNGFQTCSWEKDNEAIRLQDETRGTKADYLFKVYANQEKKQEDLLTSVACEVKSEDPQSTYKKKNQDHYQKLDKDRQKKDCEYALLISELEWDSTNDAPIRKVQEYEKMYMVRPQYFIVFLSILTALSLKYKDVLLKDNEQRAKFKDAENILKSFDQMKDDILEKSVKYIDNKLQEIIDSANQIQKETKQILEASRIVKERHLQTIINKINQFSIQQVIEKIEALES